MLPAASYQLSHAVSLLLCTLSLLASHNIDQTSTGQDVYQAGIQHLTALIRCISHGAAHGWDSAEAAVPRIRSLMLSMSHLQGLHDIKEMLSDGRTSQCIRESWIVLINARRCAATS